MTRSVFVLLHRWAGLAIAAFLFVAGLTGAVISWDHELDDLLNPHLHTVSSRGAAIPALDLARQVEARDPHARVAYIPLAAEAGESLSLFVVPRVDAATGRLHALGYNQVFLDPVTGTELGRREWGRVWPITRETLVSFLYKLHYSLHLPEMWGEERWGIWLLGIVAIVWMADSFVGFYLTLPVRKGANPDRPAAVERQLGRGWWSRWKPAWKVKTSGSAYRVTFDLHRAFSLWTFALLFLLAFTAFSLNLYREVFLPLMSSVSRVSPDPSNTRPFVSPLAYMPMQGFYTARYFQPGDDHGAAGVGPAAIYFDGQDGRVIGDRQPWIGTAADLFVQAQFPVHSGRILGLPGRILISLMGLVVAMLSATGVVIWWRKRAARLSVRRKSAAFSAVRAVPAE